MNKDEELYHQQQEENLSKNVNGEHHMLGSEHSQNHVQSHNDSSTTMLEDASLLYRFSDDIISTSMIANKVHNNTDESRLMHNGEKKKEKSSSIESSITELQNKIKNIQNKRKQIQAHRESIVHKYQTLLLHSHNSSLKERSTEISRIHSAANRRVLFDSTLKLLQRRNPINDCFHIWFQGRFGTINGLRLGSVSLDKSESINNVIGVIPPSAISNIPYLETYDPSKVPWSEVNASLGYIVLLMTVLQDRCLFVIYPRHTLHPMGNFSKITNSAAKVTHNLYSDDNSSTFSLFGKIRAFNLALKELVYCLNGALQILVKKDQSMMIPYKIEERSTGSGVREAFVGGFPISYAATDERWTKAMKYFLIDLKWLVAFCTRHSKHK